MDNLINVVDFISLKNISKKYDDDKVEQVISQAHGDLKEVLGDAFFFNVMKNQNDPLYQDLLNGCEYTKGDFPLYQEGLKALLSDYAYSRYLYELNINHSPFGLVTKNSNDSTPVDRNLIKDLVKQSNIDAARRWERIEDYLNENKDLFTVWGRSKGTNSNGFQNTRFTFISTGR